MEKFLNKKVEVRTILGSMHGNGATYEGTIISYDEEFVYLDNNMCISRKFILWIKFM